MKRWIVFLVLIVSFFSAKAQYFTLSQLEYLASRNDWQTVDNYLTNRGWEYYESEKGESDEYDIVIWSYGREWDFMSNSNKAQAWFKVYAYNNKVEMITYQIHVRQKYLNIINSLASHGYKKIGSEIKDDEIITKYSNSKFILAVSKTTVSDNNNTFWNNSETEKSTVYLFTLKRKGGIYDPDNGHKVVYLWGTKSVEYDLKDGKYHGKYVSYYINGNIEVIKYYKNGILDGPYKEYYNDGTLKKETYYVNGLENGIRKIYYPDGTLQETYKMVDGHPQGRVKVYDSLGRLVLEADVKGDFDYFDGYYKHISYVERDTQNIPLIEEGQYSNNLKNGTWKVYYIMSQDTHYVHIAQYKNDVLNGVFKTAVDSIVFTYYKDGKLNGPYKRYVNILRLVFGLPPDLDTMGAVLIEDGYYTNGIKDKFWHRYNPEGKIIEKGQYVRGKKFGIWYYYYPSLHSPFDIPYSCFSDLPDSLRLSQIVDYFNDRKDGLLIDFIHIPVCESDTCYFTDCKECIIDADTCQIVIWKDIYHYKNDRKNGPYVMYNEKGEVVVKGQYKNDKKYGLWMETKYNPHRELKSREVIRSYGQYKNSNKQAIWTYYLINPDDSILLAEVNFSDGVIKAANLYHTTMENLGYTLTFDDEKLTHAKVFSKKQLLREYTIFYNDTAPDSLIRVIYKGDTAELYTFYPTMMVNDTVFYKAPLIIETFLYDKKRILIDRVLPFVYPLPQGASLIDFLVSGPYELRVNGEVLISGQYLFGSKQGLWEYYYPDQNIKLERRYLNNKVSKETFFDLSTDRLYSGRFVEKLNDGSYIVYKIKNGLKHGTAKHYSPEGKVIEKIKYKKGVKL